MACYCSLEGADYRPSRRTGEDACPYTAGYWWFPDRNRARLSGNHRMTRPLAGLDRLADLEEVVDQERRRGSSPP